MNFNDTARSLPHGQEGAMNTVNIRNSEMDRLMGKKLCFNCKERWQYGHKCKAKPSLIAIEGLEEDNEWQKHGKEEQKEGASEHIVILGDKDFRREG